MDWDGFGYIVVGSFVSLWIWKYVWEFALFKRVLSDPVAGKLCSVAAAYVSGVALGMMIGGWPRLVAVSVGALPAAALWAIVGYNRGLSLRYEQEADTEIAETFQ